VHSDGQRVGSRGASVLDSKLFEPAEATSAAAMATLSWLELVKVVVRGTPFQSATAPGKKPLPLRVKVMFPLLTGIEVWLVPLP
jgi:hypothetical protein